MRRDWYRCRGCSCWLDPGEHGLCDECREVQKIKPSMIKVEKDGQCRLILPAHRSAGK